MTALTARQEWATRWPLPLVSMLGMTGCAIFSYSSGVLMEPITRELGWSRTEFASAFVMQMLAGLVILPLTGLLADRFGPRRVALVGIAPFVACLGLLGLVGQPVWQWWALCLLSAAAQGLITQTIWVAAVAGTFAASRGLAMAVTLSGLALASVIWPLLAVFFLQALGWRLTFLALGLTWAAVIVPLAWLHFRDPPARKAAAAQPRQGSGAYRKAIASPAFLGLLLAGGLYTCASNGTVISMVPLLKEKGMGLTTAAGLASAIGLSAIAGRFVLGYMLDRLPTRPLAICAFLLPCPASLLLLNAHGSLPTALAGCMLLGFASGAEGDVIAYVAAKRFGQTIFASAYAIFTAILAVCSSLGPLLAGIAFDTFHTYDALLAVLIPMVAGGALIMAFLPMTQLQDAD